MQQGCQSFIRRSYFFCEKKNENEKLPMVSYTARIPFLPVDTVEQFSSSSFTLFTVLYQQYKKKSMKAIFKQIFFSFYIFNWTCHQQR